MVGKSITELRMSLDSSTFIERSAFEEGKTVLHFAAQVN